MTALSQNGWTANDRSVIASYSLPGGKVALRAGDVSVVLLWVANEFHRRVEPLVWPGIWGYAERPIRGSTTTLSNHSSGTAIDVNAPRHPLGKSGTFTPLQARVIREIVAATGGAVRWGGDYIGRKDEMHFEINAGAAVVRAAADRIRGTSMPAPKPALPRPRMEDDEMYVKCGPKGGPILTGLLSGGVLIPLNPGETDSADKTIAQFNLPVQWLERPTWDALVRKS